MYSKNIRMMAYIRCNCHCNKMICNLHSSKYKELNKFLNYLFKKFKNCKKRYNKILRNNKSKLRI